MKKSKALRFLISLVWIAIFGGLGYLYFEGLDLQDPRSQTAAAVVDSRTAHVASNPDSGSVAAAPASQGQGAQPQIAPSVAGYLAQPLTPQMAAIKAAAHEDWIRQKSLKDSHSLAPNAPAEKVDWSQFIPTGVTLEANGAQVELFVLLHTQTYNYGQSAKEILAEQGYYIVTPEGYPDLWKELSKPENANRAYATQLQAADADHLHGPVFYAVTREPPEQH